MEELKNHIYDEHNGLRYTLVGDYYIPDLQLPEENRPIGIWGRMHKDYLEQYHPTLYNELILSGKSCRGKRIRFLSLLIYPFKSLQVMM